MYIRLHKELDFFSQKCDRIFKNPTQARKPKFTVQVIDDNVQITSVFKKNVKLLSALFLSSEEERVQW